MIDRELQAVEWVKTLPLQDIRILNEGQLFMTCLAQHERGFMVVAKVPLPGYEGKKAERLLKNEFRILQELKIDGIRRAISFHKVGKVPVLILEHREGVTYKQWSREQDFQLSRFLRQAMDAAAILRRLHWVGYLHRNISGENLLFDHNTETTFLIDFNLSGPLGREETFHEAQSIPHGTLPYISPELTGRTRLKVDHRSDLYSFGILLYELATQQQPFQGEDPIAFIHSHLTEAIPDPCLFQPDLPQKVGQIILKLTAKNPEERYQSASGLENDLTKCLEISESGGDFAQLIIGQSDETFSVAVSNWIYGREEELLTLKQEFNTASQGQKVFTLVSGNSGVGKSSLVRSLFEHLQEKNILTLSGKADQVSAGSPFLAIRRSMQEWMDFVMAEDKESIDLLRQILMNGLGENVALLETLVPGLEWLCGPYAPLPELGIEEEKNRFYLTFRKFIELIANHHGPLVIFLDDLQWVDTGTLNLVRLILLSREQYPVMVIGSYRNEEMVKGHRLLAFLKRTQEEGVDLTNIELGGLSQTHVNELVADTLRSDSKETQPLSSLIHRKTNGNAFFTIQFLSLLSRKRHIQYDSGLGKWIWDIGTIEQLKVTENVVSFLTEKLSSLTNRQKDLISKASCLGNRFTADEVFQLDGSAPIETESSLHELSVAGLLILSGGIYSFTHDRVQQAAYSLIPERKVSDIHLKIARNLVKLVEAGRKNMTLLDIAIHYVRGIEGISEEPEREKVAQILLEAGIQAQSSSAYESALDFFEAGIDLLGEKGWQSQRQLILNLHEGALRSSFLKGDTEEVFHRANRILDRAESVMEKGAAYEVLNLLYMRDGRYSECLDSGLKYLKEIGVRIPANPGNGALLIELIKVQLKLRKMEIKDLAQLPEIRKPEIRIAQSIFPSFSPAAYLHRPKLLSFLLVKNISLSLKYGRGPELPVAMYYYAVIRCGIMGKVEEGKELADLALRLAEAPQSRKYIGLLHYGLGILVYPWFRPIVKTVEQMDLAYRYGLRNGDLVAASSALGSFTAHSFLAGFELGGLIEKIDDSIELLKDYKQEFPLNLSKVYGQAILNFVEPTPHPSFLKGKWFDRDAQEEDSFEDKTIIASIHFCELMLGVLYHQYETTPSSLSKVMKYEQNIIATYSWGILPLFAGYTVLKGKSPNLRKASKFLKLLEKRAKNSPENFRGKYLLLKAEISKVKGAKGEALLAFGQAIDHEREQNSILFEAFALEQRGRYQLELSMIGPSRESLTYAALTYQKWGAKGKFSVLLEEFPDIRPLLSNPNMRREPNEVTLDLDTVIKASQAISQQVDLGNLLEKLLFFAAQNAGADRVVFFLPENGILIPKAKLEHGQIELYLEAGSVVPPELSPQKVINFTYRSTKPLIGSGNMDARQFYNDPYFESNPVNSYLCVPLSNLGEVVAMLYMENSLIQGAFTPERVELMKVLGGQIAISVENALLIGNLEQKVKERTREIEAQRDVIAQEKKKSDDLLLNILPKDTAEELKLYGKAQARNYDQVTILFADVTGFTQMAEQMAPEELVNMLDEYFRGFDQIMSEEGIEKIKTIGDAYMCVCGLPIKRNDHALRMVNAAQRMLKFLESKEQELKTEDKKSFRFRIGIHSGSVVAGVVGSKKFAFDIWGDAVNTAARMEQASEGMKINISGSTFALVKEEISCTYRGRIAAKNKGDLEMYFVDR